MTDEKTGPKCYGEKPDPRNDTPDNTWPLDNCPPADPRNDTAYVDLGAEAACSMCDDSGCYSAGDPTNPRAMTPCSCAAGKALANTSGMSGLGIPPDAWSVDTPGAVFEVACIFCRDTGYTPRFSSTAVRGYCPHCPQGDLRKHGDGTRPMTAGWDTGVPQPGRVWYACKDCREPATPERRFCGECGGQVLVYGSLPKSVVEPHITSFACGYCRDTRLLPDITSASGQKKCHYCATEFRSLETPPASKLESMLIPTKCNPQGYANHECPACTPPVPKDPWQHRARYMRCYSCMAFVAKGDGPSQSDPTKKQLGRCRRHAPRLDGFPTMFSTDWCLDHKLDETKL